LQRAPPCVRCGRLRQPATDLISVTPCVALDVLLLVLRTGSALVVAGVEQRSAVRTGQPAARRNVTGTRRRSSGHVTRARPATHVVFDRAPGRGPYMHVTSVKRGSSEQSTYRQVRRAQPVVTPARMRALMRTYSACTLHYSQFGNEIRHAEMRRCLQNHCRKVRSLA